MIFSCVGFGRLTQRDVHIALRDGIVRLCKDDASVASGNEVSAGEEWVVASETNTDVAMHLAPMEFCESAHELELECREAFFPTLAHEC